MGTKTVEEAGLEPMPPLHRSHTPDGAPRLFMTLGLPASGKSTWARMLVAEHPTRVKRINKDDMRAMLDNGRHHRRNESFVLKVRDAAISAALADGLSVVVDDTNLHPKHASRLAQLAEQASAELVSVDFRDVPLWKCLERDAARPNPVGARAIRQMARDFLPRPARMVQDPALPPAVIVDLDGTLAELGDRNVYDASLCERDTLNPAVAAVISSMRIADPELTVIACTGRSDKFRPHTEAWLEAHFAVDQLLMRPADDNRRDTDVKRDLFEEHVDGAYRVLVVFEDRDAVVRMWRDLGLDCFQVAEER